MPFLIDGFAFANKSWLTGKPAISLMYHTSPSLSKQTLSPTDICMSDFSALNR